MGFSNRSLIPTNDLNLQAIPVAGALVSWPCLEIQDGGCMTPKLLSGLVIHEEGSQASVWGCIYGSDLL